MLLIDKEEVEIDKDIMRIGEDGSLRFICSNVRKFLIKAN